VDFGPVKGRSGAIEPDPESKGSPKVNPVDSPATGALRRETEAGRSAGPEA